MAVTLSIIELLDAIRVGHSDAEMAQGRRLRDYATTAVLRYAPSAPDIVHDEAAILIAGYLFDKPTAQGGAGFAAAGRNSGAWSALNPYRKHRAGSVAGSVDTPDLGQIDEDAINALIQSSVSAWAHLGNLDEIPADKLGNAEGGAGSQIVDTSSGRLPAGDVVMRIGWAETQEPTDAIFTRDDNHPDDGASVGTVSGLNPPVFPPALNSDGGLYMLVWIAASVSQVADVRLSGGGGTLLSSGQPLAPYEYDGDAGTMWVSNQPLSPALSAYSISAVVAGALILTEADVEDWARAGNSDEIPASRLPAGMGGDGTDEAARAAAAAAQADADSAQAAADAAQATATQALSDASSANTAAAAAASAAEAAQTTADGAAEFAALAGSGIDGHTPLITANRAAAAAAQATADAAQAAAEASAAAAAAAQATADSAGGGGSWYYSAFINGPFVGGTAKMANLRSFPQGELADYAALRAAVLDGTVRQLAVRFSENDVGDADNDYGVTIIPNLEGFYSAAGTYICFPGWGFGVDPVKFTIQFGATELTCTADADRGATLVQVRVAIWL